MSKLKLASKCFEPKIITLATEEYQFRSGKYFSESKTATSHGYLWWFCLIEIEQRKGLLYFQTIGNWTPKKERTVGNLNLAGPTSQPVYPCET